MSRIDVDKKSENVTWHPGHVSLDERRKLLGRPNYVVWLTGLSGSGKSTIGRALEKRLHAEGMLCYVLDGDNIRHGLNKDLGFSAEDRSENIRRVAEVSRLLHDAGVTVIASFISPYRADRMFARSLVGEDFIEVFVDCPLKECERRDPKGLYAKARNGDITGFTGIDAPYEKPEDAEVVVDSGRLNVEECVQRIAQALERRHART